MAAVHREAIQKQIQQDWANREYIEVITGSIKKITDFLNSFGNLTKLQNTAFGRKHCYLNFSEVVNVSVFKILVIIF